MTLQSPPRLLQDETQTHDSKGLSRCLSKKHIARIEQMIRLREEREARLQFVWGDRKKGSARSADLADMAALRALLAAALHDGGNPR